MEGIRMQRVTLYCWPAKDSLTYMEADEGTVTCRLYVELERESADDRWKPVFIQLRDVVMFWDGSDYGSEIDNEPRTVAAHWWNKPHIQARYADKLQQAADEQWLRDSDANL